MAKGLPVEVSRHNYYERRPIAARTPLHWPGGKPLAVAFLICAEYYELRPPANARMHLCPALTEEGPEEYRAEHW
jgi:hypothetical protein